MLNSLMMAAAQSGGVITLDQYSYDWDDAIDASVHTFSVNMGSDGENRVFVLMFTGLYHAGAVTVNSITCGTSSPATMTAIKSKVASSGADAAAAAIFYAGSAQGLLKSHIGTQTITVTLSGSSGTNRDQFCETFNLFGVKLADPVFDSAEATQTSDTGHPASLNLDIAAGGWACSCISAGGALAGCTTVGLTETLDSDNSSGQGWSSAAALDISGGPAAAKTDRTITMNWSAWNYMAAASASFRPA